MLLFILVIARRLQSELFDRLHSRQAIRSVLWFVLKRILRKVADTDFNDIVLEVEGSVEPIHTSHEFEYNTYTFCFEDRKKGDYDLNDVVIKAKRLNATTVEYSIVACGANDELYVMNIGKDAEDVHALFGKGRNQFINTESQNC